jgi:fucose permease
LYPLRITGVKLALAAYFFYCAIESTMGLWGASFLFKTKGLDFASAATSVSFFYASITLGRLLTGFVTYRMSNKNLIRGGGFVILGGVLLMLLPLPLPFALGGFLLVGFGCAPIFPCMLHETPDRFGAANAQAIMGLQMAVAYIGSTFLPPLFGFIASSTTLALLPVFLLGYTIVLVVSTEVLRRSLAKRAAERSSKSGSSPV